MSVPVPENITRQWDDGRMQPPRRDTLRWPEVRDLLAACGSYWLATVGRGPRPHVRPVLGVMIGDHWYSTASASTVKHRNLGRDSEVAVTAGAAGADLVLEGLVEPVRERDVLQELAAAYHRKYQWPVRVDGVAFDAPYGAPTAGPPPYLPFRVTPLRVFALGTGEDHSLRSTRFRF